MKMEENFGDIPFNTSTWVCILKEIYVMGLFQWWSILPIYFKLYVQKRLSVLEYCSWWIEHFL